MSGPGRSANRRGSRTSADRPLRHPRYPLDRASDRRASRVWRAVRTGRIHPGSLAIGSATQVPERPALGRGPRRRRRPRGRSGPGCLRPHEAPPEHAGPHADGHAGPRRRGHLRQRPECRHEGEPPDRLDRSGTPRPPLPGEHLLDDRERPLRAAWRLRVLGRHRRHAAHLHPDRHGRPALRHRPGSATWEPGTRRSPGPRTRRCRCRSRCAVTKGQLYHVVFENMDPDPADELHQRQRAVRLRLDVEAPAAGLRRRGLCRPLRHPGVWTVQAHYTADMDIAYANGSHDGVAYVQNMTEYYGTISGAAAVREHLRSSATARIVTSAACGSGARRARIPSSCRSARATRSSSRARSRRPTSPSRPRGTTTAARSGRRSPSLRHARRRHDLRPGPDHRGLE